MLKQIPTATFHNFKCGEIYCLAATSYNVQCCLCGEKINFDDFPKHFRVSHLGPCEPSEEDRQQTPKPENSSVREDPFTEYPVKNEFDDDDFLNEDDGQLIEEPLVEDEKPIFLSDLPIKTRITVLDNVNTANNDNEEDDDDLPLLQRRKIKQVQKKEHKQTRKKSTTKTRNSFAKGELKAKSPNEEQLELEKAIAEIEDFNVHLNEQPDAVIDDDDDDANWQNDAGDSDSSAGETNDETTEDANSFQCDQCPKKFKHKKSLIGHLNKHNPDNKRIKAKKKTKDFKCDHEGCGLSFYTENFLRCHKFKHTGIICDICGKDFTQVGNLMRHKIRHTGVKSHECKLCDYKAYTGKELTAHMMRHTGVLPHICEVCGKKCRDRGKLSEHMRRHTGERPFKCPTCAKCFFSGHDLNVHSLSHTDHRPYVCHCGARAKSKKALRVHKKLHATVKNHICKVCGKGFAQANGLLAHMRSHDATTLTSGTCNQLLSSNVDVDDGDIFGNLNNIQNDIQMPRTYLI